MDGRDTTEESLYRVLATIEPEPGLADLRFRATELLQEFSRRRTDQQSREAARSALSRVLQASGMTPCSTILSLRVSTCPGALTRFANRPVVL